ncbi:hypothetical protein OAN22_02600 [Alphaproteobacteria bacterium]|nr:hypothetical protein [Alphaproteobacteria bacterium]
MSVAPATVPFIDSFSILEGTRKPRTMDEAVSAFISTFTSQLMETAFENTGDDEEESALGAEQPGDGLSQKFLAMAAGDALARDPNLFNAYKKQLCARFDRGHSPPKAGNTEISTNNNQVQVLTKNMPSVHVEA